MRQSKDERRETNVEREEKRARFRLEEALAGTTSTIVDSVVAETHTEDPSVTKPSSSSTTHPHNGVEARGGGERVDSSCSCGVINRDATASATRGGDADSISR